MITIIITITTTTIKDVESCILVHTAGSGSNHVCLIVRSVQVVSVKSGIVMFFVLWGSWEVPFYACRE